MSELTKKSFLNLSASTLKTAGILALTFITTPIVLKLIGAQGFGTFKVLHEVYSYLSLVEMGIFASLIACIIPLLKPDKREKLEGLLAQGSWRYWKLSLLTILCGLMIFPFLKDLTSWTGPDDDELYITFALLLGNALLLPSGIYRGYLEASNKGHLIHLINFVQSILLTVITVLLAYWGWGMKSQGVALLVAVTIGSFLMRMFSDLKVDLKKRDKAYDKEISSKQKPQVLNELAGKLCLHIDQVLIGIFLGPVMVTKVFLGQRVVQIMQQQLLSVGQASWASLSTLYYQRETNAGIFEKRTMEITKILAILAVAGLVPICILNQAFIELWVGEDLLMENNALVLVASANAYFLALYGFWGLVLSALGKQASITKLFWYQAAVNVIASLISIKYLGGIGPLVGTLVSYVIVPLWMYPRILKNQLGLNELKLYKVIIPPFIVGLLCVLVYEFSPFKFVHLTWPQFFLFGAVIFLANSFVLFLFLFNKVEKHLFINRIISLKNSL